MSKETNPVGRTSKFGEKTCTISVRVPVAKKDFYNKKVVEFVEELVSKGKKGSETNVSANCTCYTNEKGIFRRDKTCKRNKEEHNL